MISAPGITLLPVEERGLFAREFEKELEFLQLWMLLTNHASPLKNVDLIWADEQPGGRVGIRNAVGTTQALRNPKLHYLHGEPANPNPYFCNLVNDFGRHEAESCLLSDRAAEERVRATGRSHVYRCHAGIVDIAVPVISGNRHIATLHGGQLLSSPASHEEFIQIAKIVERLDYIDRVELEKAYWQLPVTTDEDLQQTVRLLEVFAEYLARLWERLRDVVQVQRQRLRQAELEKTELAQLLLQGDVADVRRAGELMRKAGFEQPPNRVLVVRLESDGEYLAPPASFDLAFASALHAIEELGDKSPELMVAHLQRFGLCLFWRDASRTAVRVRSLAQRVLHAVADSALRARVGIGSLVPDWRRLADSYQEACLALTGSRDGIACHSEPAQELAELNGEVERARRCLLEGKVDEAKLHTRALLVLMNRALQAEPDSRQLHRGFLTDAFHSFALAAQRLGCPLEAIGALRHDADLAFQKAASVLELHDAFLRVADRLSAEVGRLQLGKHEKIVERARHLMEWTLEHGQPDQELTLESVAAALGVSNGHLSRLFKRIVGVPFRQYLVSLRVEMACHLLLEPLQNVSQVSQKCGFSTPAYFARVFRNSTGFTPSEYSRDPQRCGSRCLPCP
jgi:AraC-like DNA-binding protein/ligand-binding sensor protein